MVPNSDQDTSKMPLIMLTSSASFSQALPFDSSAYFFNPPVPALVGLDYSNFSHIFQLNALAP